MEMYRADLNDDRIKKLICAYLDAKEFIIKNGYGQEIDWQENLNIESISETDFLREAAWVILSVGMRELVIRGLFQKFSNAFLNWECAKKINEYRYQCKFEALQVFNNERKVNAIIDIVRIIAEDSFNVVHEKIKNYGIEYLETFPFIGPVASCHLAKNIGLNIAKPDRHLIRVSQACGFQTPNELCSTLSTIVGDDISTIDLVIWRYATLKNRYLELFI